MAGNPFRRSQILNPAVAPSSPALSYLNADGTDGSSSTDRTVRDSYSGNASPPPPAKTKKSVRIESPTSSPPHPHPASYSETDPDLPRINRGYDADQKDPASTVGISGSLADYGSAQGRGRREDGNIAYEPGDMKGSKRGDSDMVQSLPGAPANPFSRTLATIEPHEKEEPSRSVGDHTASPAPKVNLDVEGFKRLLMTGISSPVSASQPPQGTAAALNPAAASAFESSSTDTSSISRQSIFEQTLHEPHAETPRTSYEMAPSDDDMLGLVTEGKKTEKKKPPPAPKRRHGKLVSSRTPQTVSFSEFEASEPIPSPVPRRTGSDLNKPLPPTPSISEPPSHIISQDISQEPAEYADFPTLENRATDSSGQPQSPTTQKKVPPPVPLARRQSQLRSTKGNRSRSSSNLTTSSQHSISEFPILSPGIPSGASSPSQRVPPPPPPTRRHGPSLTGGNPPNAASSTTELPSTVRHSTASSPNAPSSRKTTTLSPSISSQDDSGLGRTLSSASTRNNTRSVSNESASMAPPPPPPPRRRQSGRAADKARSNPPSSTSPGNSRRTSMENKRASFDGRRRTSVASESSLKHEYAPTMEDGNALYSPQEADEAKNLDTATIAQNTTSDILDDMEKFQREIDELRERYQKELVKRLCMPAGAYGKCEYATQCVYSGVKYRR